MQFLITPCIQVFFITPSNTVPDHSLYTVSDQSHIQLLIAPSIKFLSTPNLQFKISQSPLFCQVADSFRNCRVTFKHLPQPLRSQIQSFGTLGQHFKIPPYSAQKLNSARGRGSRTIFYSGILIFLLLRSPCKI